MTDTQIVDWLEAQAKESHTGVTLDWIRGSSGDPQGFRFMRRFFIGEPHFTLRKAIEHAVEQQHTFR